MLRKGMKNRLTFLAVLAVVVIVVLGCGSIDPFAEEKHANQPGSNRTSTNSAANSSANKSLSDQAVDTALGEQRLGVPECDALMDELTNYANDPDDGFAVKLAKSLVANKIKESVKAAIDENQTDKAQLAIVCKSLKTEFDKAKTAPSSEGTK